MLLWSLRESADCCCEARLSLLASAELDAPWFARDDACDARCALTSWSLRIAVAFAAWLVSATWLASRLAVVEAVDALLAVCAAVELSCAVLATVSLFAKLFALVRLSELMKLG